MISDILSSMIHQRHVDIQCFGLQHLVHLVFMQAKQLTHHTAYAISRDRFAVFSGRYYEYNPEWRSGKTFRIPIYSERELIDRTWFLEQSGDVL